MSLLSYLRFHINDEMLSAFHEDVQRMLSMAQRQPGFQWAQNLRDESNRAVHVILSEWDSRDNMRAWEHSPDHEAIMQKYELAYVEPMVHRRFLPE